MQITYTLTFDDVVYATYAWAEREKRNPVRSFLSGIGLSAYAVVAGYVVLQDNPAGPAPVIQFLVDLYVLCLGAYVAWTSIGFSIKRKLRARMAKYPYLFAEHTLTLAPDILIETANYIEMRLKWQAVSDVFSDSKYIFIIVHGSPYIIARRNFSKPEDAEAFLSMANTYWQMAKQRPMQEEGVWPPAPRTL